MQLVFTKGSGKYDRMDMLRAGGSAHVVQCPKQGIIPHDMVHYAVESTLHKRGFISRVAHGEDANQRMAGEAESDGVERLVEVFQADGWAGWNGEAGDLIDLYRVTCQARDCPMLPLDAATLEAVRARLLELSAQWQAVPVGASLTLDF